MLILLTLFSGISFICFGLGYLFSRNMRLEFERYGLGRVRVLVAALQLAGAIGQLIGLVYAPLAALAASGLALLMLCAILVRAKIGDSLAQSMPATCYLLLELLILFFVYRRFAGR